LNEIIVVSDILCIHVSNMFCFVIIHRSYIFSGRPAQRRSSTKRRRSSFASEHDRGVMRRRSSSSGERYDRRRRYDKERRRTSHSHRRERRQSQRRSSSRKIRSRRMTTDSDNFSVSSLDAKKQENQIVLYEGAQTQPLAICDDEEKQAKKPDPDGVSVNVFMLKGVNSITTDGKEEDNDEMLLEEDADGRFISFKV
jgi:FtsZ-interacting cell division protein ZipA